MCFHTPIVSWLKYEKNYQKIKIFECLSIQFSSSILGLHFGFIRKVQKWIWIWRQKKLPNRHSQLSIVNRQSLKFSEDFEQATGCQLEKCFVYRRKIFTINNFWTAQKSQKHFSKSFEKKFSKLFASSKCMEKKLSNISRIQVGRHPLF